MQTISTDTYPLDTRLLKPKEQLERESAEIHLFESVGVSLCPDRNEYEPMNNEISTN